MRSAATATPASRGWFLTDQPVPEADTLVGRTLLVQHGDGTTRGWTLTRVENMRATRPGSTCTRSPALRSIAETGAARYYQFPRDSAPGPHRFAISQIARASRTGPLPATDVGE